MMDEIHKYLMEKRITSKISDLKPLITKPKTGTYEIDGVEVKILLAGNTLIFEYPSKSAMITYNLIQTTDQLKKKATQIGMKSGKTMKFIIDV